MQNNRVDSRGVFWLSVWVKLNIKRLDLQMAHTWTIARGSGTNVSKVVAVELIGADGTIGRGEAAPTARYKESMDTVEAFLKKVDARGLSFNDVEGSMAYIETVAQHTPLLGVLDDADPDVALVVPAAWLVWLKPGQPFTLDVDETGRSYPGRITRLGAQVDPVSQTVTIYGTPTDSDRTLVSGMSGTARFPAP